MTSQYAMASLKKKLATFLFGTATQTNYTSKRSDFLKKLIDTITTSNFYYKFKENNENDMTFCYFSCLGRYYFRPTSMVALSLSALARYGRLMENMDKGLTVPKWVLIVWRKIPQMPQNLSANLSARVQNFWTSMKKGFIRRSQSVIMQIDMP